MSAPHRLTTIVLALLCTFASSEALATPTDPIVVVPEAWRDRARRLVDPGEAGLPGGLRLDRVELGDRITAHYVGQGGRLTVDVLPPKGAGEDAVWTGQRIALVLREATIEGPGRAAALGALERLLQQRESAWGWLKQAPEQGPAGDAERQRIAELVERAERLAALGEVAELVTTLEAVRATPPTDLPTQLRLARLVHRAELAPELRAAFTEAAVQTAARAQASLTEPGEALDRLRLALAGATALAGRADDARRIAGPIVKAGRVVCETWRVARDLGLAGELEHARALADLVVLADPRCDAGHAVRVQLALRAGDREGARKAGAEALAGRPDAALARSALAHLAMAEGDPHEAITYARVGLREQPADAAAMAATVALVGGGAMDPLTAERWKGAMRRHVAQGPLQLQGIVACLALEEPACALDAVRQARAAVPEQPLLASLEAVALARDGQVAPASAALAQAWAQAPFETTTLVAEAEVAMAEGDAARARRAWRAYAAAAAREGGLVSVADAKVMADGGARPVAGGEAPPSGQVGSEAPGQTVPPTALPDPQETQDRRFLVYGLAMAVTLALAIGLAIRRRRKA